MSIEAMKQEPVGYLYDWLNPDGRDEVIRDWFAASLYIIEKDKGFNVRPLYTAPVHASKQAEQEPVAWAEEIIDDLHASYNSEMIKELDSGDELIRLDAAVCIVEEVAERHTAPVHASENAEKQEPVAFRNINTGEFCTGGFLRKDWAKWQPLYAAPVHASDMSQERVDETAKDQHEPVEYDCCANCLHPEHEHNGNQCPKPLTTVWHAWDYDFPPDNYTAPLKREWVGLTDEEIMAELPVTTPRPATSFARAIEAKLRSKNT
jgi:hypothetical protein